jgi:uncharacterized protein YbbC (DUF1343 family)
LILLALVTGNFVNVFAQPEMIKTGADQTENYFPLLKGKKVGLVGNQSSLIGNTPLADSLIYSGIELKKIFSPEHGYEGEKNAGAEIKNSTDHATGVPVISLYGPKKKPTRDDMNGIDIMIYDIQDVGVRFYTYISTLHYVMEACAESQIPLIILDHPDPNGHYVDGPVLDTAYRSFIGMNPIPLVYGMTAAELAMMINGENWLKSHLQCSLILITCKGYSHALPYRPSLSPSPALPTPEAIYLYPSLGLFEGTVMSVGRGTAFPFQVTGHPQYPDRSFSFTPVAIQGNNNPLYRNQVCYGIDLSELSADTLLLFCRINLKWLMMAYKNMNMGASFFNNSFNLLAGNGVLKQQIISGATEEEIRLSWEPALNIFKENRKKYLLYD